MGIGADIPRRDGVAKLLGSARYVDDLIVPGVLHGGAVRSQVPRGRIKHIHFDPTIDWGEFVIVDHRDIPGPNEVLFLEQDQPALVEREVHHQGEPIVLLAHRNISALRRALQAVRVEVEPLPAVLDPLQPLSPELVQYGADNVFKRIEIRKGDAVKVLRRAARVVTGEYQTGAQEHVYLETQGVLAQVQDGRLVIQGTLQCPYYVLNSLMHLFARPADGFQVIQTPTGGGFGGKEDYPSILAIHAGLLAEKAGKPVKIVHERHEDMAVTTKRHPSWVRHRTAVAEDGQLLAMDINVVLDGGAFVTLSPVVLSRGVIHAGGPYRCDHVRIGGEARLTNSPPNGAFRGFGAPQTQFAMERHMNVIAQELALDPIEVRRRNLLSDGDATATGQIVKDGVDLPALMDHALDCAEYHDRQVQHKQHNTAHAYTRRGLGVATFFHGAGFTGSGESYLGSEVWVEGLPDGRVELLTANTDMGQGTETVLAQIAAQSLGIGEDHLVINMPDTTRVPNSGPTVASRTVMVVGKLLEQACLDLVRQVGTGDIAQQIVHWHAQHPGARLLGRAKYRQPDHIRWDEEHYRGDAYACYSWATHVAEVEVDLRTYSVRVSDYVALQEVGKVINPVLATGQVQGGVAQGIGWALTEDVVTKDGIMINNQMTNYIIPGSADLPPLRVFFEERPSEYGPQGAKGLGELPMDGPAPAVINAVCDALDISISAIPLTPERLMTALGTAHG